MTIPKAIANDLLFEVLSELEKLASPADLRQLFERLVNAYGLTSVAYLGSGLGETRPKAPYLAVTYSTEWVEHYLTQRFVEIDPTIQVGMRRLLPIDWASFDRSDLAVRRLFGEAQEFGLGKQGLSLPVHGQHRDRALVSITSNLSAREWRQLRPQYMRDFQVLTLHIHEAILRLEGSAPTQARLSPRERECLMWIAEGKTYWEAAMILGLSEHTVRCYLESARHKLGAANNTHAVNKAGKADLLSKLP